MIMNQVKPILFHWAVQLIGLFKQICLQKSHNDSYVQEIVKIT